ncbi:MAG: protein kinase, partial [Acidobacteriota bacterium]
LADLLVEEGDLDAKAARALQAEADAVDRALTPPVEPGRRLGSFVLGPEIGRGGMGIVFEAKQESLGRTVALKVLPAGAALDDRLASRFLREARAVARLRHPGIVPVFEGGRADGVLYFAMERVDGPSLAELLAAGPLPPGRAAAIALALAQALDHAHRSGVIHRDLKPENVLIDRDGRPRLVDFGLALDRASGPLTRQALGTPAYTAPEQARGEPVDERTDLYSLGAVLYHMLAAEPPYEGETAAVLIARLLTEEPAPLDRRAPEAPEALVAVCRDAMQRDPERRPRTALEIADRLERFLHAYPPSGEDPPASARFETTRKLRRRIGIGALFSLVLALGLLASLWPTGGPLQEDGTAGNRGRDHALSTGTLRRLATGAEPVGYAALSPDGRRVVYSVLVDGVWQLRVGDTEGGPARSVAGEIPGSKTDAVFSPAGDRLAFRGGGGLWIVDLRTGKGREIVSGSIYTPDWSPDGREIAFVRVDHARSRLWAVSLVSGYTRLITSLDARSPRWSPQGHRIAFLSRMSGGRVGLFTIPADGGEPVRVTRDAGEKWSPSWSSDGGSLYFASIRGGGPDIWRCPLDVVTGEVLGTPQAVTRGLLAAPCRLHAATASDRIVFGYPNRCESVFQVRLDASGGHPLDTPRSVSMGAALVREPRPSPSGDRLITVESTEEDLFVRVVEDWGSASTKRGLTHGLARDGSPRWSPDGKRIAFHSDRGGAGRIWLLEPATGDVRPITDPADGEARRPVWSPDGELLAYSVVDGGARLIRPDEPDRPSRPLPAPPNGSRFEPSDWSPDGELLAGTGQGLVLHDLRTGRYRTVLPYGKRPTFAPDGNALLFAHDEAILRLDLATGSLDTILSTGPNTLLDPIGVDRGRRALYYAVTAPANTLWLLDLDAPGR